MKPMKETESNDIDMVWIMIVKMPIMCNKMK